MPPHQHPEYEAFCVMEGEVEFGQQGADGLRWMTAKAGETVSIPGQTLHAWRNSSGKPARLLVSGPGRLGEFFEEAGVPVQPGDTPGPPSPEEVKRVMAIAAKFGHRFAPR